MFDRSLIVAILFLIWWFYPYFFQIQGVFSNLYFLYQSWKYLVPICVVVCLLCRKDTLNQISEYFPLRKIITTIFSDDTYAPEEWQSSPKVLQQQAYYNSYGQTLGTDQNYGQMPGTDQGYGQMPSNQRPVTTRRPMIRKNHRRQKTHSKHQAYQLAASQGGKCGNCQRPIGNNCKIGRIIPLNQGGSFGPDNLQAYCPRCYLNR